MFNFHNKNTSSTAYKNSSSTPTPSSTRLVSAGTLGFYNTLCTEKGVAQALNESSTHNEVQVAIEEMRKLPNYRPASEPQLKHIKDRTMALGMPEVIQPLSMSQASDLIVRLDTMFVSKGLDKLITPPQIEFLNKMAMCPDIPTFTIHLTIEMLDKGDELQVAFDLAMHNLNTGKGTQETVALIEAEMRLFQAECEAYTEEKDFTKLDKELASNFIQAYQKVYYAWANSRASEGQRALLKTLSARTGEVFTDAMLMQYSGKEANAMIDQLQKEMGRTYGSTLEPNAREIEKGALTAAGASEIDEEKLHGIVHSLFATIGQEADADVLNNPSFSNIADLISLLPFYGIGKEAVDEILGNVYNEEEKTLLLSIYE